MSRRTDTPGDLLFGLLALQTGLITQTALVAAFHAWAQARDRPLGEILVEQGALDASHRGLVEGLVGAHLKTHGGEPEKSLAALGAGPSTREHLAGIGDPELDATLTRVGPAWSDDGDDVTTLSFLPGSATSAGQRFRVVRNHAKGGLGEVFVAVDTEFNREVALKEIQLTHAHDPASRERFLREAEITGNLEHPGIVPVYGLGTYADGRPFYAMRFIKGDSLKEAIASFHADEALRHEPGARSLELRKLLRRFLDVCNAIEYAHERGVLHRDLKPGNIMVGRYGETLVVDWGLARARGMADREKSTDERTLVPSSASGSSETLPGSALGTPGYMSPEQAAGDLDRLGPRSDVYSLGATLYCLLTGKPPFEGRDVGAILRAVQKGEFPRPREVDPAVDVALEAVCLKAMALKPEDRYGSPRALADDVERWSADEPVSAHHEGPRARLGRWARRHRAWVLSGAASLALVMVIAVLFAVEQGRSAERLRGEQKKTVEEQKRTKKALIAETEQRKKAVAQTEVANSRLYFANMNSVQRFWDDNNPRMFRQFLDEQLPEHQPGGIDRRNFEWYYWERRFSSGYYTLMRESSNCSMSVAFSPDGKRLAASCMDFALKVWDVTSEQEILTLEDNAGGVKSVSFSADGRRLALASRFNGAVNVWDFAIGQDAFELRGHDDCVNSVSFSPDGKRLASASDDGTVKVWDAATGREQRTLKGHPTSVQSVAFSPDSKWLASASLDGTVKVWDAATGHEELMALKHSEGAMRVAFSPDGKWLASAGYDRTVRIWDAATGHEERTLKGHSDVVYCVRFSPDGRRLASAGADGTVKMWDAARGHEERTLKGHSSVVMSVSFSPDGKRLASASMDGTVKVWDAATKQEALTLLEHSYGAMSVAFSPDGKRLASASRDGTVEVWDAATGREQRTLKGHSGWVNSVAFSADGKRLASAGYEGTVKIWDPATGHEERTLKGHSGWVKCVAFSPDGKRLASAGTDGTVKIWDPATGHEERTLSGHTYAGNSVSFSPDGSRLASAGADSTVKIWDAATGHEERTLSGHTGLVNSVAFSPNGKRLASAGADGTVKVWDAVTGQEPLTLKGHTGLIHSVAFSPDGKRLASASTDGTVRVWDAATGQEVLTLKVHSGWVNSVVFSPDGKRLASASDDKMVRVWDVRPLSPAERQAPRP